MQRSQRYKLITHDERRVASINLSRI